MPRTTQAQEIEQRKTLVEWIIEIMAIFWSVWWGFYMQEVLQKAHGDINIPIRFVNPPFVLKPSADFLLSVNALVVSAFAVTFVLWLWSVHKTAYRHFLVRSFVRASAPLGFVILIMLSSISLMGNALSIPSSFMNYGMLLTLLWPLVVLVTIWKV